jgi:hypothetical protein
VLTPTETPSLTIELEVKLIRVPEDRRKSFDKKDEKNQIFVDSIRRVGVLQPIDVRKVDDRYELVFGRRRLWAVKYLGRETIPCKISSWTDNQVARVGVAENNLRGHLTPTQYARQMQLLFREFERCFGPDPGKAAGGIAQARSAQRNPETKRFTQAAGVGPKSLGLAEEPAVTAAVNGGAEDDQGPTDPTPRGYSALLAEATGKHQSKTSEDTKIATSLTPDQLVALDECGRIKSKEDLLRLARIADEPLRDRCVKLVCSGSSVQDAIARVEQVAGQPGNERLAKEVADDEMSDEAWLAVHCAKLRSMLQDPSALERAALLYRHDRERRQAYRARSKDLVFKTRAEGWDPFSNLLAKVIWVEPPDSWYPCHECHGRNMDSRDCVACRGCGFEVRFKMPPRSKVPG